MGSQDVESALTGFFQGFGGELQKESQSRREVRQGAELERRKRQVATQFPTPLEQEQVAGLKSEREIQQRRYGAGGLEEKEIERKRLSDFMTGVASLEKASSIDLSDLATLQMSGIKLSSESISDLERRKRDATFQQMKTIGDLFGIKINIPKESIKKIRTPEEVSQNISQPEGRIKVREKKSKRTGTIPLSEFDSNLYERL